MPPPAKRLRRNNTARDLPQFVLLTRTLLLALVMVSPRVTSAQEQMNVVDDASEGGSWTGPELRVLYKTIFECSRRPSLWHCLKLKALWLLERVRSIPGPIPLTPYLSLVRDPRADDSRTMSQGELESQASNDEQLDVMLVRSADRLVSSRSLQINVPNDVFEGRGKKKDKYGGAMLMAGAAMAGMMLQLALGKIALIAGKALLVAKVALVLSTVIGLKKLAGSGGGGGGGGDSHQVVYASEGHGGGGGWGRSRTAHEVAYNAHDPNQAEDNQLR